MMFKLELRSCVPMVLPALLASRLLAGGGRDHPEDDGAGTGNHGGQSGGNGVLAARVVTKGRLPLTRSEGAIDANAKGRVEVRSKRGRERLLIQAERFEPGLGVDVFIADENGDLQLVAMVVADSHGQAKVKWDTKKTDLALGAAAVADLAGREVVLRTTDGGALLEGTVPDLGALSASGGARQRDRSALANADTSFAPQGEGKVTVDFRPTKGRSKLQIEVDHVPAGSQLEILLESPASGDIEKVAEFTASSRGEAEQEFNTQDGDALPFGVSQVSELFGKNIEIRSPDGSVRFTGGVPTP